MFSSVLRERKCANNIRIRNILVFVKLHTSQIVTQFNTLQSHNVAHNCDHATFTVDCCYDILQRLLHNCTSTKASVKFQAIHHTTSSIR